MLAQLSADTREQLQELLEGKEEKQPQEPSTNTFKCFLKSPLRSLLHKWLGLKLAAHRMSTNHR